MRYEFQHRGSVHLHGLLWLAGAPDVDRIEEMDDNGRAELRANIGFSPIISKGAVINYIAKYASKAEPRSATYSDILKNIIRNDDTLNAGAVKVIQKLLITSVSERDISAQKCCHLLMGYNLCNSNRQVVTIVIHSQESVPVTVEEEKEGSSVNSSKTILQKYPKRSGLLETKSFPQIAEQYRWTRTRYKLRDRGESTVVPILPRSTICDNIRQNEEYYRQQVILQVLGGTKRICCTEGNHGLELSSFIN